MVMRNVYISYFSIDLRCNNVQYISNRAQNKRFVLKYEERSYHWKMACLWALSTIQAKHFCRFYLSAIERLFLLAFSFDYCNVKVDFLTFFLPRRSKDDCYTIMYTILQCKETINIRMNNRDFNESEENHRLSRDPHEGTQSKVKMTINK